MKTVLFTMLVAYIQPVHFLKLNIVGVRINGLIFLSNLMSSSNPSFQHGVFVRSIELKKKQISSQSPRVGVSLPREQASLLLSESELYEYLLAQKVPLLYLNACSVA